MNKIFILCFLILISCSQKPKEDVEPPKIKKINDLEKLQVSKKCQCQSAREISTPQFIDEINGTVICFDDIRNYYDEFETNFFTIYDCIGDSVIFDKNYGPDKCLMKDSDSIVVFDLVIQTPIRHQLFIEKRSHPQFIDTRFIKYTLDKRSKNINVSLLDSKMNEVYYGIFLEEYEKNKLNLNHLRDWRFQKKLLLSCWFKPKKTESIYKSIKQQIENIHTFDGEPFWDYYNYFRFIYTENNAQ